MGYPALCVYLLFHSGDGYAETPAICGRYESLSDGIVPGEMAEGRASRASAKCRGEHYATSDVLRGGTHSCHLLRIASTTTLAIHMASGA